MSNKSLPVAANVVRSRYTHEAPPKQSSCTEDDRYRLEAPTDSDARRSTTTLLLRYRNRQQRPQNHNDYYNDKSHLSTALFLPPRSLLQSSGHCCSHPGGLRAHTFLIRAGTATAARKTICTYKPGAGGISRPVGHNGRTFRRKRGARPPPTIERVGDAHISTAYIIAVFVPQVPTYGHYRF